MNKQRIDFIFQALEKGLEERQAVIRLAFLSAMAGESIFLLGPPGVAKSLIARRLKHVFKDAEAFEYLMNRFSTPDEIFGPVSIQKLKQDVFERKIQGYLPAATVVFLDEIWKAGPSIQNTLLTVINEKIYRNGTQEIALPLKSLVAASNELPAEGQGLGALWDRFLVRCQVDGIKEAAAFDRMVTATGGLYQDPIPGDKKITTQEWENFQQGIQTVAIPPLILKAVHLLRKKIALYNEKHTGSDGVYVSDRRWKKILKLLRASALLNSRQEVDLMDFQIVQHCVWDQPEQQNHFETVIDEIFSKHAFSFNLDLSGVKNEIDRMRKEVEKEIYIEVTVGQNDPNSHNRQRTKTITQIRHKRPHTSILATWDQKANQIQSKMDAHQLQINAHLDQMRKKSRQNYFCQAAKFSLLESQINGLQIEIGKKLTLLKELQSEYRNVEDGKIEEVK